MLPAGSGALPLSCPRVVRTVPPRRRNLRPLRLLPGSDALGRETVRGLYRTRAQGGPTLQREQNGGCQRQQVVATRPQRSSVPRRPMPSLGSREGPLPPIFLTEVSARFTL